MGVLSAGLLILAACATSPTAPPPVTATVDGVIIDLTDSAIVNPHSIARERSRLTEAEYQAWLEKERVSSWDWTIANALYESWMRNNKDTLEQVVRADYPARAALERGRDLRSIQAFRSLIPALREVFELGRDTREVYTRIVKPTRMAEHIWRASVERAKTNGLDTEIRRVQRIVDATAASPTLTQVETGMPARGRQTIEELLAHPMWLLPYAMPRVMEQYGGYGVGRDWHHGALGVYARKLRDEGRFSIEQPTINDWFWRTFDPNLPRRVSDAPAPSVAPVTPAPSEEAP